MSWATTCLILCGPVVLPRAIALYRNLRAPRSAIPRPLSSQTSLALSLLFGSAIIFLLSTLPIFSATNIFQATQSRLQAPTNVLFNRVAVDRELTILEERLRSVFQEGGLEARLLYLKFGPEVLSTCRFVDPKDADASVVYMLYALPTILAPHLANLLVLGIVTSVLVAGAEASGWRNAATLSACVLAVAEIVIVFMHDHRANAQATHYEALDNFYWKARVIRGICISAMQGLFGWLIYLSATNTGFCSPPSTQEQIAQVARSADVVLSRVRGLGAVRNVIFRDAAMRAKIQHYWTQEDMVMRSIFEEREVVDAVNEALSTSDVAAMDREAKLFVDNVLGPIAADTTTTRNAI